MSPTAVETPAWLLALGRESLPTTLRVSGEDYTFFRIFKHDFFAATALYAGRDRKVVLKAGRAHSLFGIPMTWLGRWMTGHEARLYRVSQGIDGIPALIGFHGPTRFVHEYVEGHPLRRDELPGDEFFPRLSALLDGLHYRGIAYVDLEKPENILLGDDGKPHLIDFQIAWHVPVNRLGQTWPARKILTILQSSDRYHLFKHWRKLRGDQLPASASCHAGVPFWIRWHRKIFRPITLARRQVLVWMGLRESIKVRSPG